ncbi:MAG: DUF3667 domain-containing protein [Prevotella sp.]|nr:DUF3667 domain-containing protein [Prevotella sp.]
MKALKYITNKEKRQVWLRAFRMWQRRPYEVAPLSDVTYECASCHTKFQGNYCPRCGQAAGVGRFSFRKALLLFLDVWGIGNRSMFRSLRDLMLRPGYMIRDYLRGMQSAYFPPFKMFFLLTAFSLIVERGIDLGLESSTEPARAEQSMQTPLDSLQQNLDEVAMQAGASIDSLREDARQYTDDRHITVNGEKVESPMYYAGAKFAKIMNALRKKNPAIFALLTLMMFSLPLYLFIRRSPNIPDLRYSEFAVALVYTSNTFSIYSIIGNLLSSEIIKLIALLMIFVALKQFLGYSKLRLLGYIILSVLIVMVIIAAIMALGIYIAWQFTKT